jgi:hypothetical protein
LRWLEEHFQVWIRVKVMIEMRKSVACPRERFCICGIAIFVVLCVCTRFACAAFAQGDRFPVKPPPSGPVPRMADGRPDLSGVWLRPRVVDAGTPEMLPWAAALAKQRAADNFKDMPSARCLPMGVSLLSPYLAKFIQTPSVLVIIQEAEGGSTIQVFLDGRDHPKELQPTWRGHSIGSWEGDTLIIDTVGFNDEGWLDGRGTPRTEKLHVIQRIRRMDLGHLEIETRVDDPGTFVKPWTSRVVTDLAPGEEIQELICNENNIYFERIK